MIDDVTKLWMRNKSDELAAANGCWFDVERAAWVVWWIERYFPLYEGEWAGTNMLVRSACEETDSQILEHWDEGGRELSIDRAHKYAEWVSQGNRGDWQYECIMRLFGWSRYSARWSREIRRFRRAGIWIPKKQKKTPTLAAIGVYLICGDGEQGAKCFAGAKDGNQARLAMDHAIAAIEQSVELSSECKVNKNEGSILHVPTRSKYKPLSSANERSKNSKEGINGHILIDETHVVDEKFISIICRAGISRAEPLHIEVSTAGSNPEGYGKREQDKQRKIITGEDHDDNYFVAIYEAPQDLSDTDLDLDPIKWGKIANPAWGHTAHEEEYIADYNMSRRALNTLADFKMYRLNIWQHSSSPWLKMTDWDRCEGQLSDWNTADAVGIGVDIGSRDDLAALGACARWLIGEDDEGTPQYRFEVKCSTFISEKTQRNVKEHPFSTFISKGFLHHSRFPLKDLTDEAIRLAKDYNAFAIAYDPNGAQKFDEDCTIEGIKAASMGQRHSNFNAPILDFIEAVTDGRLTHDGNDLLRWCANNAYITKNAAGYVMFDKESSNEKIDAIVATVMAFRMCCVAPARATGSLFLI